MSQSPTFVVHEPVASATASNVVFSSPHSGREYPDDLVERSQLGLLRLRASEDAMVDELFASAPAHGAPLIAGLLPRAYLDLNRAPDELDPALIEGLRTSGVNQRVLAGLGVVPRVVAEGSPIYHGKISLADARDRISRYHTPFHQTLQRLLFDAREEFGSALLIDCHSMPSEALRAAPKVSGRIPEIVLGDRFGSAASRSYMAETQAAFERAGFRVARNAPFAGGYITQRYGKPSQGFHAIQVEIDRGIYLDQERIEPNGAFDEVRELIDGIVGDIVGHFRHLQSVAAE